MGYHQLDRLDKEILRLIADNARIPFLEVARAHVMFLEQQFINAYKN